MDSKETGTFSPHDNALDATNNETPASSVQSWLDRRPNTLESNVFSALPRAQASRSRKALLRSPRLRKLQSHEDETAEFGRQIGE